jgi:hypothetical protein
MKYILILLIASGCNEHNKAQYREHTTNDSNFHVELLFEVDGCKVYRFQDYYSRYFTNCKGSTQWTDVRQHGKTRTTIPQGVSGQ